MNDTIEKDLQALVRAGFAVEAAYEIVANPSIRCNDVHFSCDENEAGDFQITVAAPHSPTGFRYNFFPRKNISKVTSKFEHGLVDHVRYVFADELGEAPPQLLVEKPPRNAKFLFSLFLDAKTCDALVGDLEERFKIVLKEFSPGKAKFWYWTMALRSVGPIVWDWGKKVVAKANKPVVVWLVGHGILHPDAWLAFVTEWLKRIRG